MHFKQYTCNGGNNDGGNCLDASSKKSKLMAWAMWVLLLQLWWIVSSPRRGDCSEVHFRNPHRGAPLMEQPGASEDNEWDRVISPRRTASGAQAVLFGEVLFLHLSLSFPLHYLSFFFCEVRLPLSLRKKKMSNWVNQGGDNPGLGDNGVGSRAPPDSSAQICLSSIALKGQWLFPFCFNSVLTANSDWDTALKADWIRHNWLNTTKLTVWVSECGIEYMRLNMSTLHAS